MFVLMLHMFVVCAVIVSFSLRFEFLVGAVACDLVILLPFLLGFVMVVDVDELVTCRYLFGFGVWFGIDGCCVLWVWWFWFMCF